MARVWQAWRNTAEAMLQEARDAQERAGVLSASFFSHQAAESALKAAWIVAADGNPPHSHNLVQLAEGLEAPAEVVEACRELNPLYMTSRYPDAANGEPAQQLSPAITARAVAAGDLVLRRGGGPVYRRRRRAMSGLKLASVARAEAASEHESVLEAVRDFARCVAERWNASEVYLFGSRARDDWRAGSDADLMVVAESLAGMTRIERAIELSRCWRGPVGCEVAGYTADEFARSKADGWLVSMAFEAGVWQLWPEQRRVQDSKSD